MRRKITLNNYYELAVYLGMENVHGGPVCHYHDWREHEVKSMSWRHNGNFLYRRVTEKLMRSHAEHYLKDFDNLKQRYREYNRFKRYWEDARRRCKYKIPNVVKWKRIGLTHRQRRCLLGESPIISLRKANTWLGHYVSIGVPLQLVRSDTWKLKKNVLEFFCRPLYHDGVITQTRNRKSGMFAEYYSSISIQRGTSTTIMSELMWFEEHGIEFNVRNKRGWFVHPTIKYPTRSMLSKDTLRPPQQIPMYQEEEDHPHRECQCSWASHSNPYFCDDNWRQREHDSWESLRDKD